MGIKEIENCLSGKIFSLACSATSNSISGIPETPAKEVFHFSAMKHHFYTLEAFLGFTQILS